MSPFRPSIPPQSDVYPKAQYCLPTTHFFSIVFPPYPLPTFLHKSRLFISLPPLCRSQKSQLLCNQANPDSFAKTPGVGYPLRSLCSDLSALCVALLPAYYVFSTTCRLLFSLASLFRTRSLCFQQLADSFAKNRGVGGGYGNGGVAKSQPSGKRTNRPNEDFIQVNSDNSDR